MHMQFFCCFLFCCFVLGLEGFISCSRKPFYSQTIFSRSVFKSPQFYSSFEVNHPLGSLFLRVTREKGENNPKIQQFGHPESWRKKRGGRGWKDSGQTSAALPGRLETVHLESRPPRIPRSSPASPGTMPGFPWNAALRLLRRLQPRNGCLPTEVAAPGPLSASQAITGEPSRGLPGRDGGGGDAALRLRALAGPSPPLRVPLGQFRLPAGGACAARVAALGGRAGRRGAKMAGLRLAALGARVPCRRWGGAAVCGFRRGLSAWLARKPEGTPRWPPGQCPDGGRKKHARSRTCLSRAVWGALLANALAARPAGAGGRPRGPRGGGLRGPDGRWRAVPAAPRCGCSAGLPGGAKPRVCSAAVARVSRSPRSLGVLTLFGCITGGGLRRGRWRRRCEGVAVAVEPHRSLPSPGSALSADRSPYPSEETGVCTKNDSVFLVFPSCQAATYAMKKIKLGKEFADDERSSLGLGGHRRHRWE
ncbi:palmitoyl-protein thioesterase ABHD10, mitochondrial isoform 2-T2 [Lycaon pictus]